MRHGSWLAACGLLLLTGGWASPALAEVIHVRLVGSNQTDNPLLQYRQALLTAAIQSAGHTPDVRFCQLPGKATSDKRAAAEVASGVRCNMLATSMGAAFTRPLSLIPVPIYLGGGGYRVLLSSANSARLDDIDSLATLRALRLGSGTTWVDTAIFRANQLNVVTSEYPNLFAMLKVGRFDALPRAVFEALPEVARFGPGIGIEPRLLIHYPGDLFFYGSPANAATNAIIASGLNIMYHSGAFHTFIRQHPSTRLALQQLDLSARLVIELENPYLGAEQREILRRYPPVWLDPYPSSAASK